MENIRTKIQLAVEGGKEVGKLSDQITNLGKDLRLINTGAQGVVNSFRVVNKVLSEAKKNFRDVSLDVEEAAKAAEQLVAANNQVNATLRQRNQLLQDASNKLARESGATTPEIQRALSPTTGGSRQQQMVNQQVNEQLNREAQGVLDTERMRIAVRRQLMSSLTEEERFQNQLLNIKAQQVQKEMDSIKTSRISMSQTRRRLRIENKLRNPLNRIGHNLRGRGQGPKNARGMATSNAIIGGAFPLLFGQGPAAAIGGGLGALAAGRRGSDVFKQAAISGLTAGAMKGISNYAQQRALAKGLETAAAEGATSGSAALDLAYVGSGRLDGYFHNNINLWDIAAGILIVKEAGGSINDISKYDDDDINIRAANSNIFTKMMENLGNF